MHSFVNLTFIQLSLYQVRCEIKLLKNKKKSEQEMFGIIRMTVSTNAELLFRLNCITNDKDFFCCSNV